MVSMQRSQPPRHRPSLCSKLLSSLAIGGRLPSTPVFCSPQKEGSRALTVSHRLGELCAATILAVKESTHSWAAQYQAAVTAHVILNHILILCISSPLVTW